MQLATWNINSLKTRIDIIKEWLYHNPVDFLLLQEIKGENEEIFKEFEPLGYKSYFHLQKTYNGVATLTKEPCEIINKGLPYSIEKTYKIINKDFSHLTEKPYKITNQNLPYLIENQVAITKKQVENKSLELFNTSSLMEGQARFLEIKYKNIHILNAYMPNGNPIDTEKFAYKINWLNSLYLYLKNLIENNIDFILAGDFNIAPFDKDVYSVKAFANDALTSKEARDIFFKILNLGLTDSIEFKNPNVKNMFTWWDYRNAGFAKDWGMRIDHILLSPKLADSLNNAYIDKVPRLKDKPSDHTPVICVLDDLMDYNK